MGNLEIGRGYATVKKECHHGEVEHRLSHKLTKLLLSGTETSCLVSKQMRDVKKKLDTRRARSTTTSTTSHFISDFFPLQKAIRWRQIAYTGARTVERFLLPIKKYQKHVRIGYQ